MLLNVVNSVELYLILIYNKTHRIIILFDFFNENWLTVRNITVDIYLVSLIYKRCVKFAIHYQYMIKNYRSLICFKLTHYRPLN